jgi:hypothetical protein
VVVDASGVLLGVVTRREFFEATPEQSLRDSSTAWRSTRSGDYRWLRSPGRWWASSPAVSLKDAKAAAPTIVLPALSRRGGDEARA